MALRTTDRPLAQAGSLPRWAAFAAGDLLVFVLFAGLGRSSHHEASSLGTILGTAAPLAVGWFAIAPWAGVYTHRAMASARAVLTRTAYAWVCAWPLGLLLRALVLQRGIPLSFAIVVLLFNGCLLIGWRGLYALMQRGRAAR